MAAERFKKMTAPSAATRSMVPPDVPTIAEAGVLDVDVVLWLGIIAPAGMPQPIVSQLNATINETIARPEIASEWARRSNADCDAR
jgi:tripartite-type tricarboxylate transporter receptor subunit TctC